MVELRGFSSAPAATAGAPLAVNQKMSAPMRIIARTAPSTAANGGELLPNVCICNRARTCQDDPPAEGAGDAEARGVHVAPARGVAVPDLAGNVRGRAVGERRQQLHLALVVLALGRLAARVVVRRREVGGRAGGLAAAGHAVEALEGDGAAGAVAVAQTLHALGRNMSEIAGGICEESPYVVVGVLRRVAGNVRGLVVHLAAAVGSAERLTALTNNR
jgi:hypothetical protein